MSREIKFRAWFDNGKAQDMFFVGDAYGTNHPLDCCRYAQDGQPVTLMQYTGLKDKNGVEVYEGDIVEQYHFTSSSGKVNNIFHRVVWSDKYSGWSCLNCKSNDESDGSPQLWVYSKTPFAVVGNIYQNSDLLS